MKTKHILLFALATIVTFSACKKEDIEEVLAAVFDSAQFVQNNCSDLSTLSSPNGGVLPTTIRFENETGETIRISWVNFTGGLTVYKENLETGNGHTQSTFLQHPWYVETSGSECITIVTALRAGVTDTVRFVKQEQ